MATAVTPPPVFGTVLIARSPQDSPSPLELQMRHKSSRSRVVQKLSGGAHLLLPSSDTTVAVRAYFPQNLKHDDDDDDLVSFRNAFKYPLVFFVLPPSHQQQALGTPFLNRAQEIMNYLDGDGSHPKDGSSHVFIVQDVATAIQILSNFCHSLKPEKRALKRKFGESIRAKYNNDALHVQNAFRTWADRFELSVGAADVLMGRLGTLREIATADGNVLDGIPALDESSKMTLHQFFGSTGGRTSTTTRQNVQQPQQQNFHQQHSMTPGMPPSASVYPQSDQMNRMTDHGQNVHQQHKFHQQQQGMHSATPPAPGMPSSARAPLYPQPPPYRPATGAYRTPPPRQVEDSIVAMMQAEHQESMGFSQFEQEQEWMQDDHEPVAATPHLVSQQYMAVQQQQQQQRPLMSPPNVGRQRLLPRFNRQVMGGNAIRPMSAAGRGYYNR